MTANTFRILIAAGFVIVGATLFLAAPAKAPGGPAVDLVGVIGLAAMAIAFVLEVKEWLVERRKHRAQEAKSTAIQALPVDDEPVTLHYSEGGER